MQINFCVSPEYKSTSIQNKDVGGKLRLSFKFAAKAQNCVIIIFTNHCTDSHQLVGTTRSWESIFHVHCACTSTPFYATWHFGPILHKFCSTQGGIYTLRKALMCSTISLRSFPNVAFETNQSDCLNSHWSCLVFFMQAAAFFYYVLLYKPHCITQLTASSYRHPCITVTWHNFTLSMPAGDHHF